MFSSTVLYPVREVYGLVQGSYMTPPTPPLWRPRLYVLSHFHLFSTSFLLYKSCKMRNCRDCTLEILQTLQINFIGQVGLHMHCSQCTQAHRMTARHTAKNKVDKAEQ